jgi:hypothetical protein
MMMQVPENEVMDQTDLVGSLVHKQTTDFTTMISKVRECLSIFPVILLYPEKTCAYWYPSISIFGSRTVSFFCQLAM